MAADTITEDQFRTDAVAFLGANAKPRQEETTTWGEGNDKVKDAYLRKMYRGDIVGCQLFSEPAAGSDLAGLQGRAVRDGDEWILNGQKVWTSGAQYSDIGEIIMRTDADAPKHKGL